MRVKATDEKGLESSPSSALAVTVKGQTIEDPVVVASAPPDNNPPRTPYAPDGEFLGKATNSYTYKTVAFDPDGDVVKYSFDWGTERRVPQGMFPRAHMQLRPISGWLYRLEHPGYYVSEFWITLNINSYQSDGHFPLKWYHDSPLR